MSAFKTKQIDKSVKEAMFKKMVSLNRGVGVDIKNQGNFFDDSNKLQNALEPKDSTNPVGHHLVRSVFVRVQADVVSEDKLETAESSDILVEQLAGYMEGNITDNTVKQGLRPISFNKSPFNNDKNYIWRGQSGITGVEVQQQSFYVKTITINWECPDPKEFEDRWLTKFLKHGRFMVVEFGWGIDQEKVESVLGDGEDRETIAKLIDIKRNRNKAYAGSYQLETGIVQSYDYKMTSNGGYNGTITLVSRGHNLLKQPISSGQSKSTAPILYSKNEVPQYKNSTDKEETKRKFIEAEATFKEVIDNLETVADEWLKGSTEDQKNYKDTANLFARRLNTKFRRGVMGFKRTGNGGFDKTHYLVSWGWFEDFILNSFFRVKGKAFGGDGVENELVFQEFRSVTKEQNEDLSTFLVNNKCNNTTSLESLGLDTIVLPGQFDTSKLDTTIEKLEKFIDKHDLSGSYNDALFQYRALRHIGKEVNTKFKLFGNPNDNVGIIRNMVFNVDYLKERFKDVTNVQEGIKNFWDSVEDDYSGFFDFYIQTDYENNGRIGMGDYYYQNEVEEKVETDNPDTEDTPESFAEQGTKADNAFVFSLNSKNSIVKEFSLDLKLTAEAATLATYGNSKKVKKGSLTAASSTRDLSIERFVQLFSKQEGITQTSGSAQTDGGSSNTGNNLDDIDNQVKKTITELSIATEEFGKGLSSPSFSELNEKGEEELVPKLSSEDGIAFDEIGDIKKNVEKIFEEIDEEAAEIDDEGLSEAEKAELKQINQEAKYNLKGNIKDIPTQEHLEKVNTSPEVTESSNYNRLNVTIPIELSMTIDGVGGLDPGDVFLVDYLPKIYRKYAYFQIFTINHSISTSGWDTKITAKMKLNNKKMIKDGLIEVVVDDVVVDEEERIFLGAMGVGLDDAQSIRDERAAQEQFAFESAGFNFGYNQP